MLKRGLITLSSTAMAIAIALLIVIGQGLPWRIPLDRINPTSAQMRSAESSLCLGSDVKDGVRLGTSAGGPIITCSHNKNADKDIYVWGDSHARHLLAGLIESFPNRNIHILYFTSCLAQSGISGYYYNYEQRGALAQGCVDRNIEALNFFSELEPTAVILHQYFGYKGQFSQDWFMATQEIINRLEHAGHQVAFVGGVPRPGVAIAGCLSVPSLISDTQLKRRCAVEDRLAKMIISHNMELTARFPEHFVNVTDFFCTGANVCKTTEGNTLLFRDTHHLTVEGSRLLLSHIKAQLSNLLKI